MQFSDKYTEYIATFGYVYQVNCNFWIYISVSEYIQMPMLDANYQWIPHVSYKLSRLLNCRNRPKFLWISKTNPLLSMFFEHWVGSCSTTVSSLRVKISCNSQALQPWNLGWSISTCSQHIPKDQINLIDIMTATSLSFLCIVLSFFHTFE